ncbi:MAG: hypothetical protein WBM02_03540 [bacterium]
MKTIDQTWLNVSEDAHKKLSELLAAKENTGKVARIFIEGYG